MVDLEGVDLEAVDLEVVDLEAMNLEAVYLWEVDLQEVNLQGVDLQKADLQEVVLQEVDFEEINLEEIRLDAVNVEAVSAEEVNLEAVDLKAADLEVVDLEVVNLEAADMKVVDLYPVDLEAVYQKAANLDAVDLVALDLEEINLAEINLEEIHLEKVNLLEVNLEAVNIVTDNLDAVNLVAVSLMELNLVPVNLEAVNLKAVNLEAVNLEAVNLKAVDLEFSIRLIVFEAWWETIGIQALRKTFAQRMIHFGYPEMYLVWHILESIRWMGSGDNFTTGISERLHIANVKEAYPSSNKVNYIRQMLEHNDQCTGLDYVEETLTHLALDGWYDIDPAQVFNLMSATDKRRSTRRAHLLRLQTFQDEPIISPVSQQLYHLRETHVRRVCRSIKLISLRDASEHFRIPNFGQLFRAQIEEDWGHEVSGLVLGYHQNVLIDSICIKLQNGLLYYRQPFHNPTSVERLGLDCKVEYTNAHQGMMPEAHNIWVQYTQSEENDLDNTFQGPILSFSVLYFSWTPPKSDPPISRASAHRESNIYHFEDVQEYSAMGITSSSSWICGGDSNKVQRSSWLGWLCWWVHLGCQTNE